MTIKEKHNLGKFLSLDEKSLIRKLCLDEEALKNFEIKAKKDARFLLDQMQSTLEQRRLLVEDS